MGQVRPIWTDSRKMKSRKKYIDWQFCMAPKGALQLKEFEEYYIESGFWCTPKYEKVKTPIERWNFRNNRTVRIHKFMVNKLQLTWRVLDHRQHKPRPKPNVHPLCEAGWLQSWPDVRRWPRMDDQCWCCHPRCSIFPMVLHQLALTVPDRICKRNHNPALWGWPGSGPRTLRGFQTRQYFPDWARYARANWSKDKNDREIRRSIVEEQRRS